MHQLIAATLLTLLPLVSAAQIPIPHANLAEPGPAPVLATWAAAGQSAPISLKSTAPLRLSHSIYQAAGPMLMPVSSKLPLPPLIPGENHVEIPLPASSERGNLLIRIASDEDGKALVHLSVHLLPADAWENLVRTADDGGVFIDPALTEFRTWAAGLGVRSPDRRLDQPVAYYFGRPEATPDARFIIYERESPDPLPVIEVITGKTATTILLPPGFLKLLPASVPAQALLLKHLQLLNAHLDQP